MASAQSVVARLVARGLITEEGREAAVIELHRELTRRARRNAIILASMAADKQLLIHSAEILSA